MLLNCSKRLSCAKKRKHLDNYMQLLKNSGYSETFRAEILKSGLKGYNLILQAERESVRPVYRPKGWKESARWLEKKTKKEEQLARNFLEIMHILGINNILRKINTNIIHRKYRTIE